MEVPPEIKLTIENALLHNNKQLTDEFDKTIEKHMGLMTKNINQQTQPILGQIVDIVRRQENQNADIENLKTNQKIQKKTTAYGIAAALIILGVLQFLITQSIAGR